MQINIGDKLQLIRNELIASDRDIEGMFEGSEHEGHKIYAPLKVGDIVVIEKRSASNNGWYTAHTIDTEVSIGLRADFPCFVKICNKLEKIRDRIIGGDGNG